MSNAVGMIEISSIAIAHATQDIMLKSSSVELLVARTICSGKYLVIIGGDVASVEAAIQTGEISAEGYLISSTVIPRVHESVFPALGNTVVVKPEQVGALGIIETFSATAAVKCGDAAAKAADIVLFRIHVAMAIGGKGFLMMTGDVAAVQAAMEAGIAEASEDGLLVAHSMMSNPRPELFREYI